ncbi:MAG: hypothetical protein H7Z42_08065 [Roseiflexaceae bacterium]|nr:hypothetical protein [Roseiflexaceae bacterium]
MSENFSAAAIRARINVFSLFGDIKLLRVATTLADDLTDDQQRRILGDGSERVDRQPYEGRTTQLERDA